ncbi:MAG: MBL fold metallo-hydrolase [Candidatus Bathyarchaeia archaeon]
MSADSNAGSSAKLRFLGGTKEVGRSAVAVSSGKTQILLDYGIAMNYEPGFPIHIPPKEVNAIVLTHAHLDHSGGIPIFHVRGKTPVYATSLTFELTKILLSDLINLSGYYLPYEYLEVDTMMQCRVNVSYSDECQIGDIKVGFLDAGHIPGSAQLLLDLGGGKRLAYTGDINTVDTQLLSRASTDYGELSHLIIEATYVNEDHPERSQLEKLFVARAREVVERGGTVLVPAFSVGRSQEILCILAAHKFEYPVVMDGMALKVNEIMLQYPQYFKNHNLLRRALEGARWVSGWRERKEVVKSPGVIVSPAGMLKGGAAAFYIEKVANKKQNAIFLVSFQIPGTPGRVLLEERKVFIGGKAKTVEAEVERFDFTSHCGRKELEALLKEAKGNPTVYTVHGSPENCMELAEWVEREVGLKALAPSANDSYKL